MEKGYEKYEAMLGIWSEKKGDKDFDYYKIHRLLSEGKDKEAAQEYIQRGD